MKSAKFYLSLCKVLRKVLLLPDSFSVKIFVIFIVLLFVFDYTVYATNKNVNRSSITFRFETSHKSHIRTVGHRITAVLSIATLTNRRNVGLIS